MPRHRLFSWGANSHGQLGHGAEAQEELVRPREVDLSESGLGPDRIGKITGGAGHSLLLTTDGQLYGCEAGVFRRTPGLPDLVDVACGWDHSLALAADGGLFVWGSAAHGQLGLGPGAPQVPRPARLQLGFRARKVAAGLRHSALIADDSTLWLCGDASKGQLGLDLQGARRSASFVRVPGLENVVDVACGQHHTVAVTRDKLVFAWGDNKHGQLGLDPVLFKRSLTPVRVGNCEILTERVFCGWTHTSVLTSNKKVLTWGRNSYGQLGRGQSTPATELWKMEAPDTPARFAQLAIGSEHNVALCENGSVVSWGWNEHGNCGNDSTENVFVPTEVLLAEGSGVLVATGAGHSFAVIKTDC